MTDVDVSGAVRAIKFALDGLYLGDRTERSIIAQLVEAYEGLGAGEYTPPTADRRRRDRRRV
ncbi:MAG: hypothetical protein OXP08_03210 [bacterium]|nr:hypothetical protein [bacterium]